MVKLKLSIRMEVDNVTEIAPKDDFEFTMTVHCTSCREEHSNPVSMNINDDRELSGSRGSANFVWRCPHCKKEHSASFFPPTPTSKSLISPYLPSPSSPSYQPLIALDCRGLEPLTFIFASSRGGQWRAQAAKEEEEEGGKKGGKGKNAEFEFELDEEGRWDDYDEVNGREVGVREIEWKWERA